MSIKMNESNLANDLIEKAIEIFSIKGYEATNLTDITDSLHVSRGPIYYHFNDKYGLYKAAYDRYENEVRAIHTRVISQNKHIIKIMEDIIYEYVKHNKRFGTNFLFGVDTLDELSIIREQSNKLNCEIYEGKIDLVNKAISNGDIKKDIDAKLVVDMIYLVYLGIINATQLQMMVNYKESDIKSMVTVLLIGIEKYCFD